MFTTQKSADMQPCSANLGEHKKKTYITVHNIENWPNFLCKIILNLSKLPDNAPANVVKKYFAIAMPEAKCHPHSDGFVQDVQDMLFQHPPGPKMTKDLPEQN